VKPVSPGLERQRLANREKIAGRIHNRPDRRQDPQEKDEQPLALPAARADRGLLVRIGDGVQWKEQKA
jgi:hypothetical protein